jgi:hypothetical protein
MNKPVPLTISPAKRQPVRSRSVGQTALALACSGGRGPRQGSVKVREATLIRIAGTNVEPHVTAIAPRPPTRFRLSGHCDHACQAQPRSATVLDRPTDLAAERTCSAYGWTPWAR